MKRKVIGWDNVVGQREGTRWGDTEESGTTGEWEQRRTREQTDEARVVLGLMTTNREHKPGERMSM